MTIGERLSTAGTYEEFRSAARAGDRARMIVLLKAVEVSDSDARAIASAILANPGKFGVD